MTGTIDAHPFPDGAQPQHGSSDETGTTTPALVEQAKGVLIFRYAVGAEAAYSLIELWAAETDHTVAEVAYAVVHEICQGERSEDSDPTLVRWLEDRLRHEFPGVECEGGPPTEAPADAGTAAPTDPGSSSEG